MQVEKELTGFSADKDMIVTIGVFDGVHLGHKHLISQLKEHARKQDCRSGVITFHQHPLLTLSDKKLPFLTDLATRTDLLKTEGVDAVIVLSFSPELAQLGAREFLSLLKTHLRMRGLLVGPDFALGQNREGDIETLRRLGQEMNFSVTVVEPIIIDDKVVSSTAIRKALGTGDVETVLNLTGRPFSLHGRIIGGAGRGVTLGFPTANLDIDPLQALPENGVYATRAYIDGKAYKSMTNIGINPTFGGTQRTVEVYILDYHDDLYGQDLKVDVINRLRPELRFDTAEELARQIAEDVKQGKAILDSSGAS